MRWYREETTEPVVHRVLPSCAVDEKRAGGKGRGTDLEPMQFCVVVWLGETGEHEIVGILEEAVGVVWIGVFGVWICGGGRLASVWVDDTKLDDWGRVDGAAVGCGGG